MSEPITFEPTDAERLKLIEERQKANSERMGLADERMDRLETAVGVNTDMTRDVHEMLMAWRAGMNAIAKFGRGLAVIGKWLMKIIKWAGAVAAAGVAIWTFIQTITHGAPPK